MFACSWQFNRSQHQNWIDKINAPILLFLSYRMFRFRLSVILLSNGPACVWSYAGLGLSGWRLPTCRHGQKIYTVNFTQFQWVKMEKFTPRQWRHGQISPLPTCFLFSLRLCRQGSPHQPSYIQSLPELSANWPHAASTSISTSSTSWLALV